MLGWEIGSAYGHAEDGLVLLLTAHFDVSSAKLLMNEMDEGRGELFLGLMRCCRGKSGFY
jgi:hypothetical protein